MVKCERCDGTALVYAYRGKPLGVSHLEGLRISRELQRNPRRLAQHGRLGIRLLLDLSHGHAFHGVKCPDCDGRGNIPPRRYVIVQVDRESPAPDTADAGGVLSDA